MNHSAAASQQQLMERLVSWRLVEARLSTFPAIGRAFPLKLLLARRCTPPYFCHYMAWRLGTWKDERLLVRVNALLEHAESLPYWEYERPLLRGGDFADFWSLVWQLQVAEYLSTVGTCVSWHRSGPDLSVDLEGKRLFVECYVYRKSLGVELFIGELLSELGNDLRASHHSYLRFSLPQGDALSDGLSLLLSPLVDIESLAAKRRLAQDRYPVVLSQWPGTTLSISLEGSSVDAYDPRASPQSSGDPATYLQVALREAATAKVLSNQLYQHRPNLLVAKYLLSAEAQLVLARSRTLWS